MADPVVEEEKGDEAQEPDPKERKEPKPKQKAAAEAGADGEAPADVPDGESDGESEGWSLADDLKFKSQDSAAQSFRTLRGQNKKLRGDLETATARANEWHDEYQKLKAQSGGARGRTDETAGGKTESGPSEPVQAQGLDALKKLDYEKFARLAEDPEAGLQVAAYYLQRETAKVLKADFEAEISRRLEEALKPYREDRERAQASQLDTQIIHRGVELFQKAGEAQGADGNALYPELKDETTAMEVIELWQTMDLPEHLMWDLRGVRLAVMEYRALVEQDPRRRGNANGGQQQGQPPIVDPQRVERARVGGGGTVEAPGRGGLPPKPTGQDKVRAEILNADLYQRSSTGLDLGFAS